MSNLYLAYVVHVVDDIRANCAEGKSAQSTKDFISKYEIALKEAQEFCYWCEVMIEAEIVSEKKFSLLLQEAQEITNILAASIRSLKKKKFFHHQLTLKIYPTPLSVMI